MIKLGEEVNNRFIVKFMPGGASVLQQQITIYSNANVGKSFFIFDGDQKRSEELFDVNTLSDANKTIDYLKNIIKDQTGVDIKFYPDGGVEGGNQDQLTQMMISFLKYYKEHIFYLPQAIPEDLIWAEEEVKQKLNLIVFEGNIDRIRNLDNNKDRIYEVSKILFGVDNKEAMEDILITEWLEKEDANFLVVKNIINLIEEKF